MATQNTQGSAQLSPNAAASLPPWLKALYDKVINPYVVQPVGDIENAGSEALRQAVGVPKALTQMAMGKPHCRPRSYGSSSPS